MADNIYDYIKENFGIEVKDYTFKRDYIKNPLRISKNSKNTEIPYKNDLKYFYNILNLSLNDLCKIFNSSYKPLYRWFKLFNIKKDEELKKKNYIKSLLKKYNVINLSYVDDIIQKRKLTNKLHFGVSCSFQSNSVKEKCKLTKLRKYGNPYYYNKEKARYTRLRKYGDENFNNRNKALKTMMKNNTLGKSRMEVEIYELLKQKYPNTIHHYKSDLYPFVCDFYIPEIDTYIEYQGFWTHGNEPYIGTPKQLEKVKLWESKNTPQYNKAINDWTIRDPLKRKTANKNNLKYIEFFNIKDIYKWIKISKK